MKKTTQIHIGGRHFFIDDDAFQKLNHYLESLKRHFASDGDTGSEIVEDIEQRIAELLEKKLTPGKQSITAEDVNETISVLGNIEDFTYSATSEKENTGYEYGSRRDNRRFYRDPDNYYLGGVSGGMGQYFDIDPLWIRLAFVLLFFAKGVGLLVYLILWIVVPKARTTAEKLQMRGRPVNLSTIKDSVNEEYERFKTGYPERSRNALENVIRAIGLVIVAIFKFIIGFIGVVFLIMGSVFLAGLIMAVLGFTNFFGHYHAWNGLYMPDMASFFASSSHYYIAIIALIVLVLIPIIAIIYAGVKILFNIRGKHPILRAFLLTGWILALILFISLIIVNIKDSPLETTGTDTVQIESGKYPYMVIALNDNIENKSITHYSIMGMHFNYSKWDDALFNDATLSIERSSDNQFHLTIQKRIKNADISDTDEWLDEVRYDWNQTDSVLTLDKYFLTDDDDFWMFPRVDLTLKIPEGQKIIFRRDACDIMRPELQDKYCGNIPEGKKWMMSPEGALLEAN